MERPVWLNELAKEWRRYTLSHRNSPDMIEAYSAAKLAHARLRKRAKRFCESVVISDGQIVEYDAQAYADLVDCIWKER